MYPNTCFENVFLFDLRFKYGIKILIALKQQYVVAYSCTKKIVLLSAETTSLLLSATKQIHQRK